MHWVLLAISLVVFVAASWHSRRPLAVRGNDGLIYVGLSESLEHGSYRDTYLVGSPSHHKYPPLYPFWLIPIRQVSGGSFAPIRVANICLTALSFFLVFGVSRKLIGPWLGAAGVFLLATTPVLQDWSTSLMSESLFTALTIGALVAAFQSDRQGTSAIPAMVLAWLAFLTRTAGVALLAALVLWLWRRRKPAELGIFALGCLLVVGGWFGYTQLSREAVAGLSYARDFAAIGEESNRGWVGSLLAAGWHNAVLYATEYLPFSLSLPTIRNTLADNFGWLVAMTSLLLAGWLQLWREWRPAAWFLPLYLVMLTLWPWPNERFLIPALPLVLLTMFLGAHLLVRSLPVAARRVVLMALVGLIAVGTIRGSLTLEAKRRHCDRVDPLHSPGCYQPEILSLVRGMEYVGAHTTTHDIVMTSEPVTVNYLTGRRTLPSGLLEELPPGRAQSAMRNMNVRFAILSSVRPGDRGPIGQALFDSCGELRIAASFDPHTLVIESAGDPNGGPNACSALSQFLENMKAYGDRDP